MYNKKKLAVYDKKNWLFDQWISICCFKRRHLTYEKYCAESTFCMFIEKDFKSFLVFNEVQLYVYTGFGIW